MFCKFDKCCLKQDSIFRYLEKEIYYLLKMILLGIKSFVIIVFWYQCLWINRSSRPKVFCKKGVLRNFAKFTVKHLRQSLFFNKIADLFHRTPLVAASTFYLPYRKKEVGIKFCRWKKSSVKNYITGKIIRHFLPPNFFAWLSENINWIFSVLVYLLFKKTIKILLINLL